MSKTVRNTTQLGTCRAAAAGGRGVQALGLWREGRPREGGLQAEGRPREAVVAPGHCGLDFCLVALGWHSPGPFWHAEAVSSSFQEKQETLLSQTRECYVGLCPAVSHAAPFDTQPVTQYRICTAQSLAQGGPPSPSRGPGQRIRRAI